MGNSSSKPIYSVAETDGVIKISHVDVTCRDVATFCWWQSSPTNAFHTDIKFLN